MMAQKVALFCSSGVLDKEFLQQKHVNRHTFLYKSGDCPILGVSRMEIAYHSIIKIACPF